MGLWVLDRLGGRPAEPVDALALGATLGLGILALATLALGMVAALNRAALSVVLAAGFCVGWRAASAALGTVNLRPMPRWGVDIALQLALTVTLTGTLLTTLAPVTDGDALCYHLQVPKVFLAQRTVGFEPDLHETVYPLVTELLYAIALAFRGPVACRLVSWVVGLLFAANVAALARSSLGARAWWAGVIALLVPAVSNGMSAPLNDVALAAFGAAAILGWMQCHDDPTPRRAVLAGVLLGFALGVKYPALILASLLGPALFVSAMRRCGLRRALLLSVAFAAAALVVGGPWYVRAAWYTGNPVYPFFRHVFGGSGLDEVLDPHRRKMVVTLVNVLTALAPLTLQPDRFDSFAHQLGPVFLLFVPALLLERPPRRVVAIVAVGYVFLILCMTQRQSMRFLLIAVGPLSVGVAWLAHQWRERTGLPCRILVAALVLILCVESGIALGRARRGLGVVLGREDAAAYLARREPTYRVGRWMAENLPEGARVVGQDHRGFYLPRPYAMELAHRRRTRLGRNGESARDVVDHLQRAGFTHVMLCPPRPETPVEFDPTLSRLLAPWLAQQRALYREELADGDGVVRQYAIYALAGRSDEGTVQR
jgi:hypothetical protein